jgi:hypothetical protein
MRGNSTKTQKVPHFCFSPLQNCILLSLCKIGHLVQVVVHAYNSSVHVAETRGMKVSDYIARTLSQKTKK